MWFAAGGPIACFICCHTLQRVAVWWFCFTWYLQTAVKDDIMVGIVLLIYVCYHYIWVLSCRWIHVCEVRRFNLWPRILLEHTIWGCVFTLSDIVSNKSIWQSEQSEQPSVLSCFVDQKRSLIDQEWQCSFRSERDPRSKWIPCDHKVSTATREDSQKGSFTWSTSPNTKYR